MSDERIAETVRIQKATLAEAIRLYNLCDWGSSCAEVSDMVEYFQLLIDGDVSG